MVTSYSSNSQNSKTSNGYSANVNNTASTAVSSTPTPPLSSIPPVTNVLSALPPLPMPPNMSNFSPNKAGTTFRFNTRQASPPSSTTSSTRIYRECESNTFRNSQRPLLFATANTASSTVTQTLNNNLIPNI